MQLKLKLYAGLETYLPNDSENNTVRLDVTEDSTINAVIRFYKLPAEMTHLV